LAVYTLQATQLFTNIDKWIRPRFPSIELSKVAIIHHAHYLLLPLAYLLGVIYLMIWFWLYEFMYLVACCDDE